MGKVIVYPARSLGWKLNFATVNACINDQLFECCLNLFMCRGPFVLLRLELGVLSRGKVGPVEMVSEYIRHNQLQEVSLH